MVWLNGNDSPLVLTGITRGDDNQIISGDVVNGNWGYRRSRGRHQAKSGRFVVNSWPVTTPTIEVALPEGLCYDYATVIEWAENHLRLQEN